MLENIKRAITVLSNQPKVFETKLFAHEMVLSAIMDDVNTFDESVKKILDAYALKFGNDEYWVPFFEAFVILHYGNAEHVIAALCDGLQARRFSACNRAYPPAIVGLMNAAVWCDEHLQARNPEFAKKLPSALATMLGAYADAASTKEVTDSELGIWIIGQFTDAFSKYFRSKFANTAWDRIELFCSRLKLVVHISKESEKLMDEVTRNVLHLMPRPTAMKVVAEALEAAAVARKKLEPAKLV